MSDFDLLNADFNDALDRSGDYFGQNFSISSINYTQVDGTPSLKTSSQRIKMEKTRPLLVQGEFRGIEYYSIYGYRDLYNPGDLITPLDTTSTPVCTVISYSPIEEATCMRTSLVGSIYNGTTPLYTNVRYELQSEGRTVGNPENIIEIERPGLKHRFAIFARNLNTTLVEEQGLLFVENSLPTLFRWRIEHVDQRGNVMLLDCRRDGWS